ncbi:MAG: hypothetical protein J3K34DRAFT_495772 [Monoraphidium minutum]|nr:MAG: hypothetical protein J3K34DRAFT_495772 [Monoraphidium minutum]
MQRPSTRRPRSCHGGSHPLAVAALTLLFLVLGPVAVSADSTPFVDTPTTATSSYSQLPYMSFASHRLLLAWLRWSAAAAALPPPSQGLRAEPGGAPHAWAPDAAAAARLGHGGRDASSGMSTHAAAADAAAAQPMSLQRLEQAALLVGSTAGSTAGGVVLWRLAVGGLSADFGALSDAMAGPRTQTAPQVALSQIAGMNAPIAPPLRRRRLAAPAAAAPPWLARAAAAAAAADARRLSEAAAALPGPPHGSGIDLAAAPPEYHSTIAQMLPPAAAAPSPAPTTATVVPAAETAGPPATAALLPAATSGAAAPPPVAAAGGAGAAAPVLTASSVLQATGL